MGIALRIGYFVLGVLLGMILGAAFADSLSELSGQIRERCDKRLMQIEKEEPPLIEKFVDDCVNMLFIGGGKNSDVVGELCKVFMFKASDFTCKQVDTVNDCLNKLVHCLELIRNDADRMRRESLRYRPIDLIETCEELYWVMRFYTLYESGHDRPYYLVARFRLVFVQSFTPFFIEKLELTPDVVARIHHDAQYWSGGFYEYV